MPYVLPDARRVAPERAFELGGIQYPRNWLKFSTEADRTALGITWEADPAAPEPPPPTKDQLLARAQSKRRELEIGGITVAGVPVYTDPESQSKLHAARTAAKEDNAYTVKWKGAGGVFFTLNAAQIIGIADAVRQHVQDCFAAEEAVAIKVNNDTYATYDAVNGASEWPA